MAQDFARVASIDDIPVGGMLAVDMDGEQVLLVNIEGNIYAVEGTCPHAGAPLSEGFLEDGSVECPLHGSLFDIKTGAVETPPANDDLTVYQVRVDEGSIFISRT